MNIYADNDDDYAYGGPFNYTGAKIPLNNEVFQKPPLITYKHLSLKATDLCFNYGSLDPFDFIRYFEVFKHLSQLDLDEIVEIQSRKLELHRVKLVGPVLAKIKAIFGAPGHASLDQLPMVCSIGLYNTKDRPHPNDKAPRIFFAVSGGVFNVLFFDAHHQLVKVNY